MKQTPTTLTRQQKRSLTPKPARIILVAMVCMSVCFSQIIQPTITMGIANTSTHSNSDTLAPTTLFAKSITDFHREVFQARLDLIDSYAIVPIIQGQSKTAYQQIPIAIASGLLEEWGIAQTPRHLQALYPNANSSLLVNCHSAAFSSPFLLNLVQTLEAILKSPQSTATALREGLELLTLMNRPRAEHTLFGLHTTPQYELRCLLPAFIEQIHHEGLIPKLVLNGLQHSDPHIRQSVAYVLGRFANKDNPAGNKLTKKLAERVQKANLSPDIRRAIIDVLVISRRQDVWDALYDAIFKQEISAPDFPMLVFAFFMCLTAYPLSSHNHPELINKLLTFCKNNRNAANFSQVMQNMFFCILRLTDLKQSSPLEIPVIDYKKPQAFLEATKHVLQGLQITPSHQGTLGSMVQSIIQDMNGMTEYLNSGAYRDPNFVRSVPTMSFYSFMTYIMLRWIKSAFPHSENINNYLLYLKQKNLLHIYYFLEHTLGIDKQQLEEWLIVRFDRMIQILTALRTNEHDILSKIQEYATLGQGLDLRMISFLIAEAQLIEHIPNAFHNIMTPANFTRLAKQIPLSEKKILLFLKGIRPTEKQNRQVLASFMRLEQPKDPGSGIPPQVTKMQNAVRRLVAQDRKEAYLYVSHNLKQAHTLFSFKGLYGLLDMLHKHTLVETKVFTGDGKGLIDYHDALRIPELAQAGELVKIDIPVVNMEPESTIPHFLYPFPRWDPPYLQFVQRQVQEFFDWVQQQIALIDMQDTQALHPIQLAARIYLRFTETHPLQDRNGKIAELYMNAILMRYGYPPVSRKDFRSNASFYASELQADYIVGCTIQKTLLALDEKLDGLHHIVSQEARGQLMSFHKKTLSKKTSLTHLIEPFAIRILNNSLRIQPNQVLTKPDQGKFILEWNNFSTLCKGLKILLPLLENSTATEIKIFHSPQLHGHTNFALLVYCDHARRPQVKRALQTLQQKNFAPLKCYWKMERQTLLERSLAFEPIARHLLNVLDKDTRKQRFTFVKKRGTGTLFQRCRLTSLK